MNAAIAGVWWVRARPVALRIALVIACGSAAAADGETLFKQHCAVCHQPDGGGTPGLAPPLANALARQLASSLAGAYLAQVLVAGIAGPLVAAGQTFNSAMPGVGQLPDDEIVELGNYVARALNAATGDAVSSADVAAARQRRGGPGETLRMRRALFGSQP